VRLPRDLSGRALAAGLSRLGYALTHQTGSHMRLTTSLNGEHHVTVPDHDPLRVGTRNAILRDVVSHHRMTRDDVLKMIVD